MIHGVKYFERDTLYLKKEHLCPNCQNKLETVKCSQVVNSNSPEAKDFDFSMGVGRNKKWLIGDVKFVWKEFECPECKAHFTVNELKKIEGIDIGEGADEAPEPSRRNKIKHFIIFVALGVVVSAIYYLIKNAF